jgi:hypothetical protein
MWKQVGNFLAGMLALALIVFFIAGYFRYPTGASQEIEGIVETSGMYDTGGSSLHGRVAALATIRLSSGALVRAGVLGGLPISKGTRVLLLESPQNFGTPNYAVIKVIAGEP